MFETWTTSKMEATELFAVAAGLGIVAHLCFFRRIEVDTHPLLIAVCFSAAPFAAREVLRTYFQQYGHITTRTSVVTVGCFVLSLWTSILLYRAFFHPLKNFPGPRPAKLSKIWAFLHTAKTGLKWYQVDEALHQEYGDYVRTGLFLIATLPHVRIAHRDYRAKRTFNHRPDCHTLHPWFWFQDV